MRRSRTREGIAISLFPFLAVLLCTMGALLVLLVLFGHSIGQQDESVAAEQAMQMEAELQGRADSLLWRLEQMKDMRSKTNDELETLRLQLAGIEDNSRTLAAELKDLQKLREDLLDRKAVAAITTDELRELEAELATARESLDEARQERDSNPPAYAVIPYEGSSGTHRRPLFIECSLDGVFLQPEGIRLNPEDFEGPAGPGNPLASGLRAAREYLARQSVSADDPGLRPYPLLLVRPSGVMAYYAARDAIASWGSDFGYQLIEEDWRLAFPEKDLALRDVELQAINEARERLQWLAQTRSAVRRKKPVTQQYRASSVRGGAVAVGGPSVLGDQSQWDWSKQQKQGTVSRGGHDLQGRGGDGTTGQQSLSADLVGRPLNAGESAGGSQLGSGRSTSGIGYGRGAASEAGSLTGNARELQQGGAGGGHQAGQSHFGNGSGSELASSTAGFSDGHGSSDGATGGQSKGVANGSLSGTELDGSGNQQGPESGEGGAASAVSSSSSSQSEGLAGGAAGGSSGSSPSSAAGSMPMPIGMQVGTDAASSEMVNGASGQQSSSGGSLAGSRGSDWASFATSQRYIPLTRPIQIECAADELRLFDDSGRRVVYRIPFTGSTDQSIDSLVLAIRRRVDSWGLAGDRLYWKPELVLTETEDGGGRREDVQVLLANSGIETRQKQDSDAVRRLPAAQPKKRRLRRTAALETAASSPEVGL
ncbi:MAG: hypothetical protein MUQ67_01640 [Pirellulales bacterium]|nr:hypothetical protein [Pirellulales bacterium]